MTILINVVERSRNCVFENDNVPTALKARVLSYALGAYKVNIERVIVYTLEGGHWISNHNF